MQGAAMPMWYLHSFIPGFTASTPKGSKKKWTPEEDARLTHIVAQLGASNWKRVADHIGTRNPRQCRERWKNYLCPSVCRDPWSPEEDTLLREKYAEYGSQWSVIAKFFENRTDVSLKNRWVVMSSRAGKRGRRENITSQVEVPEMPLEISFSDWTEDSFVSCD